jgi:hypothetical protein
MREFIAQLKFHGAQVRLASRPHPRVNVTAVYRPERPADFVPRTDPRHYFLHKARS